MSKQKEMTLNNGSPVVDNDNSLSGGSRAPLLLQDHWLLEKIAHFDRERIPERVVHAKGVGAFGEFTVTNDITEYTKADIFSEVGKKTKLLARISTVAGERGAADAERDIRGFALKFYTHQGNWDLVGNNTPVFFIRDPLKFPDLIHTQKRDPKTNLRNNEAAWDYWSLNPESYHQVLILMSDRGIPSNARQQHGFGSHTYSFINKHNERFWVKFHWRSQQGIDYLTDEEAKKVVGEDRESSQTDLLNAIKQKDFPKWKFYIQIMPEKEAYECKVHPFDLTKVWPHKNYPLIEVGEFELNEIPENYFQSIELAAFNPANIVPGIGFSPDKVLQGRIFSYGDTQRYRLGVNHQQIPVNTPICPYHNTHRDGTMRVDGNAGSTINYAPNYQNEYSVNTPQEPPLKTEMEALHYDFRDYDEDYFSQPKALYDIFNEAEKERLAKNIATHMSSVKNKAVLERAIELWKKIDTDLAKNIRKNLEKK
ncbi:MAG: catalase [Neisseriaceae bacterium]|nr:MAG: catalase [Neisseriaceae bacterium]